MTALLALWRLVTSAGFWLVIWFWAGLAAIFSGVYLVAGIGFALIFAGVASFFIAWVIRVGILSNG
jgi:hypothetical protein